MKRGGRGQFQSDFLTSMYTETALSLDDWKRVLDDLASFKPAIAVTNTEPSLYPDLFPFIDYAHGKGMEVWLTTNGFLLRLQARKILESGLERLQVSIDGPREVHDSIRGVEGVFDHAEEGIKEIMRNRQDGKPHVNINYVISPLNYYCLLKTAYSMPHDEITFNHMNFVTSQMAKHQTSTTPYPATATSVSRIDMNDLNLDVLHRECMAVRKMRGYGTRVHIHPDLNRDGLERHYRGPLLRHKHMRTCNAMTGIGQILADGSVTISTRCPTGIRFGNVTEKPFTEIWYSKTFNDFRAYLKQTRLMPVCLRCCGAL